MRNIYLGICARKGRGRVIIALIFRTDTPSSQYRTTERSVKPAKKQESQPDESLFAVADQIKI
jgi:hypothetical protein